MRSEIVRNLTRCLRSCKSHHRHDAHIPFYSGLTFTLAQTSTVETHLELFQAPGRRDQKHGGHSGAPRIE